LLLLDLQPGCDGAQEHLSIWSRPYIVGSPYILGGPYIVGDKTRISQFRPEGQKQPIVINIAAF